MNNESLLPPSSSAWLRSAEAATARLSGITVAIRSLWTPTACPVDLLPYLAWALSVDRWDKSWPADKKIGSIQQSYWIHRRKGTRAAVRRVIEGMGFSATFAEWFDVGDEPGTFRLEVDVSNVGINQKVMNELDRLISNSKPVSRRISQLTISVEITGHAFTGVAMCDGEDIEIYPPGYTPDGNIYYDGSIYFDANQHFSGASNGKN